MISKEGGGGGEAVDHCCASHLNLLEESRLRFMNELDCLRLCVRKSFIFEGDDELVEALNCEFRSVLCVRGSDLILHVLEVGDELCE